MKLFITVLFFSVLISSCGVSRQWRKELEVKWLGKTRDELIAKRGKPYQINNSETNNSNIYIYHHTDFTPDMPPNDYYEEFLINDKGIIYKIKTYSH